MAQSQATLSDGSTDSETSDEPTKSEQVREELPPEKLLATNDGDLIWAAIRMLDDLDVLRAYVSHENRHQNRTVILHMLARKAEEIRCGG